MRILLDFPWYFVLLCLLLGAAYSVTLYWLHRGKVKADDRLPRVALWVLSGLRFLAVSLIAFLLLAPLVKREVNVKERPILLVAQDNTQSVLLAGDSAYYKGDYAKRMESLLKRLEKDFDVHRYTFDMGLQHADGPDYEGRGTDMASALTELSNLYLNRNVGAVLVTGDGIINHGKNPTAAAESFHRPFYAVALGDTTQRCDAAVAEVRCNSMAYMGNQFALEVAVQAHQLKGRSRLLSVTHEGKVLFSQKITYDEADFFDQVMVLLDAEKPGLQRYVITLQGDEEEATLLNNRREVVVEIIDGRQKVLLLAAAPHPDLAAIRHAVEANQNFEVTCTLADDFKGNMKEYNLVLLHQLPAKGMSDEWVRQAVQAHVPLLFVVGGLTDLNRLNALHLGVEIYSKLDKTNESAPLVNKNFSCFSLDESVVHTLEQMPPLVAPFGEYRMTGVTQTLLTAKVGSVNSGLPLMAFAQQQDIRVGFVLGEGLWRWRLMEYQINENHEAFDELIRKAVTYTSIRINKNRFQVVTEKLYVENEVVTIGAELYDDNYEPVNTPEVKIAIVHPDGEKSDYIFNRQGNGYTLQAGALQAGEYHYEATTNYGGKMLTSKGSFVVQALNLEALNLVADHALLNTMATLTDGAMVTSDHLNALEEMLQQREDIKSVIYTHTRYAELLNLFWVFLLILLLLSAEWVMRKYYGI